MQFRFGGRRRPQRRTSVAVPLRAASASRRTGLVRYEHIGGNGQYVCARAVRYGRRDSAAQDAYRPIVDASVDRNRDIPSRHRPIEDQPAQ